MPSCSTIKHSKKNISVEVEVTMILRNVRNHSDFHKVSCKCYANRDHHNLVLLTCLELVITRWTHQAVRIHISSSYLLSISDV